MWTLPNKRNNNPSPFLSIAGTRDLVARASGQSTEHWARSDSELWAVVKYQQLLLERPSTLDLLDALTAYVLGMILDPVLSMKTRNGRAKQVVSVTDLACAPK